MQMSELAKTYEALLKAGMPEAGLHFTFFSQTTMGFKADCPEGGFWSAMQNEAVRHRLHGLRDEHAAAILDAWAGDWWLTQSSAAARSIVKFGVSDVGLFLEGEHWLSAPTVAEAVLAALAHGAGEGGGRRSPD